MTGDRGAQTFYRVRLVDSDPTAMLVAFQTGEKVRVTVELKDNTFELPDSLIDLFKATAGKVPGT